jgi:renalase
MINDFIIIGAGISGLNTARKLDKITSGNLLVLEKSRGIGGRIATRRTLNTKFDHGAQFYKLRPEILELHNLWLENNISHKWFVSEKVEHWCSNMGMTSLAKSVGQNINIQLEKQISTIIFENNQWKLISDKNEEWNCKNLVISSPLPQTLKMLEKIDKMRLSSQNELTELSKITYSKALVALITLADDSNLNFIEYQEFQSGDIFSISDQKNKNVSHVNALTITMSAEFSENNFDLTDDVISLNITGSIKQNLPKLKIKEFELKRWRYCRPTTNYPNHFLEIYPRIYLIGDAFGGASISGALRSSNALCSYIIKNLSKENA